MPTDLDIISRLIRHRRSIKPADMDPDRDIPRDLLETLLQNATWAPTHGLTEPWHFTLFSAENRSNLAATLQSLYQSHTSPAEFRPEKFEKLGKNPTLAPVIAAIGVTPGTNPKIPELEEIAAVACAIQNLHLTAAAAGLGAFWSSPPVTAHPDFVAYLGLPDNAKCLGLLYLGWPKPDLDWPRSQRVPFTQKTTWHSTGSKK